MDGIFFWPRLAKVIPSDYQAKVDSLNETIAFHLNASLVSALLSIEIFIFKIVMATSKVRIWIFGNKLRIPVSLPEVDLIVFLWFSIALVLSYLFYRLATSTALTYGHYIRTCYDLFRLDLLRALDCEVPKLLGSEQERELWQSIHENLTLEEDGHYQKSKQATECNFHSSVTESSSSRLPTFEALIRLMFRR